LLLAVLGVVAIVAAPFVMSSYVTQSDKTSTEGQSPDGVAASGLAPTPGGDTVDGAPASPSVRPSASSRRPSVRPTRRPSSPSAARSGSGDAGPAPVLVLNNSTVTGLGAATADRIRSAGWPVAGVGNLTGRTARTTVYYAEGYKAQAVELAQRLPGSQDVQPRYEGLPGSARLTLVVTRDLAD